MRSKSLVRERILQILYYVGYSYPYEIYKIYKSLYGKVCLRNVYYNIRKGIEAGDIKVLKVETVDGNFTWGDKTKRIYLIPNPLRPVQPLPQDYLKKLNGLKKKFTEVEREEIIKKLGKEEEVIKWVNSFSD